MNIELALKLYLAKIRLARAEIHRVRSINEREIKIKNNLLKNESINIPRKDEKKNI